MSDILYSALQRYGIPLPKEDVSHNKFTRWGKNARYWAVQFVGGYSFGDFSKSERYEIFEDNFDREKCRKEIRLIQMKITDEKKFENAKAAILAQEEWKFARECAADEHPYLQAKRVKSHGLKIQDDKLLIPIFDEDGNMTSMQSIWCSDDGNFVKRFFTGGRKKGCFFIIGEPNDEIIICEGYATASTIHECTSKAVVVAFDAGNLLHVSKNIRKKYPYAKIIIAADNDKYTPGNPGVTKAKEAAKEIDATIVIPEFANESKELTDFNDLFVEEGSEKVIDFFSKELFEKTTENTLCESMVDGFQLTDNSLSYYDERNKKYVFVSGYIQVIAQTEDVEKDKTGKLVEFKTQRGHLKQQRIHNSWIIKEGDAMHQLLADVGLLISNSKKAKSKLSEYLNMSNPSLYAKFVKVSGWYEDGFITENGFIGSSKELVIHQAENDPSGVEVSGNIEDWIQTVSKYCPGNSRLLLAVSAAFASILLKPCDRENFGIHFLGGSSEGKTTTLYVAASVFGSRDYIQSWRSTDNGLEGMALTHNDMLLILDEMGEMDSKKIGDSVYMLANGKGKTRANIHGHARKKFRWRMGLLSTGEVSLESRMAEANKKINAGQQLRLLHVNAKSTSTSTGVFEELHGFKTTGELADHLKKSSGKYYGSAAVKFIEKAIQEKHIIKKYFDDSFVSSKEKYLPIGAHGQDDRVFGIFFTIGFAGELATRYGITGWNVGDALTAAIQCFQSWLEEKGGVGSHEEKISFEQIKHFFSTYAQSKFKRIVNGKAFDSSYIGERAGYVAARTKSDGSLEDIYYVFPEYFKNIIAKGLSMKTITKMLLDRGILEPEGEKYFQARAYINGKQQRFYLINSKIFGDENEKN